MSNELINLPSGSQLTFKEYQEIYNDITGKTESTSISKKNSYLINLDNIIQLNHQINQTLDSLHCATRNSSVTVYHTNGQKEIFSSFERFKFYPVTNTNAIENINITYNFLEKSQGGVCKPYEISINITSTGALLQKKTRGMNEALDLAYLVRIPPIRARIKYVDYVIARTITTTIEDWESSIKTRAKLHFVEKIQKYSHWMRKTVHVSLPISFLIFCFLAVKDHIDYTNPDFLRLFILTSISIKSLSFLGDILGRLIENGIDKISSPAFLVINTGDKKCYDRIKRNNLFSAIKMASGISGTIIVAIIANILTSYLFPA